LAEKISRYYALQNAMEEDDREVLSFVLFQIFALVQQVIIFTAVTVILKAYTEAIAFTLFFISIKRYAGGSHANKHGVCLTISTVLLVGVCLLCKLVELPFYVAIVLSVAALVLVLLRAPVIHPNNPKPERRRKIMRKTSIVIAATQCVLIAAGSFVWPAMASPAALGGLAAAITLVLPVPESETE
jgi:accessory gene regulator B